ncbi:MAG: tetratricopeptide repeat protein [Planctomycetota bacterium]
MNDWLEAERRVERAHELYERGRWDEAESELRSAISVNPFQPEWHFNLGLTLEAAGRHSEAAKAFEEVCELDPGEPAAALAAASNLIRGGRAARALPWLDDAEAAGTDAVELAIYRVEAFAELRRYEDAETSFYLGQELHPENADLYAAMGETLLDQHESTADTRSHTQQPPAAPTDASGVVDSDADGVRADGSDQARQDSGRDGTDRVIERAMWCFREAARLDPDLPAVYARLARAFEQTGRLERARQLYMRELRQSPADIDTLLDLADLLKRMNRPAEAAEKLRRALEFDPRCADAHAVMSEIFEDEGDLDGAITELDVAVRLDPLRPGARVRLASLLVERGDRRKAATGPEHDRRVSDLLLTEVRELSAYFERPRADGGVAMRTTRVDEGPMLADLEDLIDVLLDAGKPATAVRVARWLVDQEPGRAASRHLLSVALLDAGQDGPGMTEARSVVRLAGNDQAEGVAAMHNLALAHMRRREWARARYWVLQAVQRDPEDSSVRRLRARLWLRAAGSVLFAASRGVRGCGVAMIRFVGRPARPPAGVSRG